MSLTRSDFGADPHAGANRNNAKARGWGSGWPNCSPGKMAVAKGGGVSVRVRAELVPLVEILLDATVALGYKLKAGTTGGYNCRPIAGTSTPSNHSWGLAIDLNWSDNPMQRTFKTDIPPRVVAMWEALGFYWGGRYQKTPDTMHMEFLYRPDDVPALVVKAKAYLHVVPDPKPDPSDPDSQWHKAVNARPGARILERYDRGTDVALLQRFLGVKPADGDFGADTVSAVRRYQKMLGLGVDAVVGPKTWAPILRDLGLTKVA